MRSIHSLIIASILIAVLLAGCLGDDSDDPDPEGPEEPKPTQDTGSIAGRVADLDLQPIKNARVTLINGDGESVKNVTADDSGAYVLNNVIPGTYLIRASAFCCEEEIDTIGVMANQQVEKSFRLKKLSDDDLKIPYEVTDDHVGFIACQFTLPNNQSSGCGAVEGNKPRHGIGGGKGLRTLVASMTWDGGTGAVSPQELEFQVRNANDDVYAYTSGGSPLEVRIDNSEIPEGVAPFEEFDEDGFTLEFSARPTPGSIVYQQAIQFDWYLHYWEEAPEGISVIPDQ